MRKNSASTGEPTRPSMTQDPNARVPRNSTALDFATDEDTQVPVVGFVPAAPEPVPVYLTQSAPARRTRIKRVTGNATIAAGKCEQLCGSDTRRRRVYIRNLDDADSVYVVSSATASPMEGFKLEFTNDVELLDTSEVWVLATTAAVDITWLLETEVD